MKYLEQQLTTHTQVNFIITLLWYGRHLMEDTWVLKIPLSIKGLQNILGGLSVAYVGLFFTMADQQCESQSRTFALPDFECGEEDGGDQR